MRVAALYDIHGNLPALEAVLGEIEALEIDEILVGGDVVLGPMSGACLDKLASVHIPTCFIQGNCETWVLHASNGVSTDQLPENVRKQIEWTADELTPEHLNLIAKWPPRATRDVPGLGRVLFCHATPTSQTEIFTHQSPESKLRKLFGSIPERIVVCGHTHMQFDIEVGGSRILNAGSVGMPFGKPGAYWLLLSDKIEFRCTTYDLEKAAQRIRATDYPDAKDFAQHHVLHPPTEESMLAVFEKAD